MYEVIVVFKTEEEAIEFKQDVELGDGLYPYLKIEIRETDE